MSGGTSRRPLWRSVSAFPVHRWSGKRAYLQGTPAPPGWQIWRSGPQPPGRGRRGVAPVKRSIRMTPTNREQDRGDPESAPGARRLVNRVVSVEAIRIIGDQAPRIMPLSSTATRLHRRHGPPRTSLPGGCVSVRKWHKRPPCAVGIGQARNPRRPSVGPQHRRGSPRIGERGSGADRRSALTRRFRPPPTVPAADRRQCGPRARSHPRAWPMQRGRPGWRRASVDPRERAPKGAGLPAGTRHHRQLDAPRRNVQWSRHLPA